MGVRRLGKLTRGTRLLAVAGGVEAHTCERRPLRAALHDGFKNKLALGMSHEFDVAELILSRSLEAFVAAAAVCCLVEMLVV